MNRRIATLALLGWYACVAVVGPGLHEVLGCEHHHHHGAAAAATLSGSVGAPAIGRPHDGSDDDGDDDDGCPLCKLLSMAQTCAVVVRPIWVANVLPHRVCVLVSLDRGRAAVSLPDPWAPAGARHGLNFRADSSRAECLCSPSATALVRRCCLSALDSNGPLDWTSSIHGGESCAVTAHSLSLSYWS